MCTCTPHPVSTTTSIPTAPASTSASDPKLRRSTRSTTNLRDKSDEYTHLMTMMILMRHLAEMSIKLLHHCRVLLKPEILLVQNLRGSLEKQLEKREKIKQNVLEGNEMDDDKIECLIDLDKVLIDDWESENQDIEIEFEQDNEGVKYATHEGVEFDTLFISQINSLAREDREEREIMGERDRFC
ncbi:hypothetical protein L1987_45880 [Smallanthus sonchifolius]|uniref:Uncharacterized protein n=1 Tax=Smallanthus sonchifolius TaxID=185202 RepID=A0ACB9FY02_9ASTR|nr:hypothetical protein L1987_45880 [Smallanthus sonchifolius]